MNKLTIRSKIRPGLDKSFQGQFHREHEKVVAMVAAQKDCNPAIQLFSSVKSDQYFLVITFNREILSFDWRNLLLAISWGYYMLSPEATEEQLPDDAQEVQKEAT